MRDVQTILDRIDLRALAEEAGAVFGPGDSSVCPLHPGADNPSAFHLYTGQDGRLHWHCFTRCPQGENDGDAITFYMRWRKVDFATAVRDLAQRAGVDLRHPSPAGATPASPPRSGGSRDSQPAPGVSRDPASPPRSGGSRDSQPTPLAPTPHPPAAPWQARAQAFTAYAQAQLWSPAGRPVLRYLHHERGLHEETLRAWGLGYNPRDAWQPASAWGLPGPKPLWCPRGVVLPCLRGGLLWTVKVRRPLPGDALSHAIGPVDRLPKVKFAALRGGRTTLYGADHLAGLPVLLLAEGEFDALLAWQAAHDLCDVASLGGAGQRLDALDAVALAGAWVVLAAYDADPAGARGNAYLGSLSGRVVALVPPAHDLTAYWQAGGDLRAWIAAPVAQHLERLLNELDERRYPELFVAWLDLFERARAATRPQASVTCDEGVDK